ncbi:hypothetical protein B0T17DRAFT_619995 [Bombardia bombarda]|uniref:Uncharacterized protein n=1 Tax=Bombardia bombarda TaxID=252184 RepID=A0AA39WGY3_9PEZI|nr:hypothetical protein B0T17DRAFT_619995 [Bombardia bombarda]
MPPPSQIFPAKDLLSQVQIGPDGRKRKTADGRGIDLAKDCELLSLLQYECHVLHPGIRDSPVQCWPITRWFRRCQDMNGRFTVETTAWEGTAEAASGSTTSTPGAQSNHQVPTEQASKTSQRLVTAINHI